MADPYHHALSTSKKYGGVPEDTLHIHFWFDQTKEWCPDFRHRSLRHHSEGIGECIEKFGKTVALSNGRIIPVRWVAEQHVIDDLGRIPTAADWLRCMRGEAWMSRSARKLSQELEAADADEGGR